MRESCLFCVRKHLAKAMVLMSECKLGYPQHRDLVIGNMSEAEDEAVKKHPALAQAIRAERLLYEKDPLYCPKLQGLLDQTHAQMPAGMGLLPATQPGRVMLTVGMLAVAFWLWQRDR